MSIRQYIPVKATAGPDPAIYCPANGYVPNPIFYIPPVDYIPMPEPSPEEILLLVTEQGDQRLAFKVNCTGGYTVRIYGAGDALLSTETAASGGIYTHTFITGTGFNGTFRVRITPTVGGNSLTLFTISSWSPYVNWDWQIVWAKFNTPNMVTLTGAFKGTTRIETCSFAGAMNSCTNMQQMFSYCSNLRTIVLPAMNSLTTLSGTFEYCTALISCVFPTALNAVTTMNSCFTYCGKLPSLVLPASMSGVKDLNTLASVCLELQSCTLPTTMPIVENLYNSFQGCKKLRSLTFVSAMPELNRMDQMCQGCSFLTTVTMPVTCAKLTTLNQTFYQCYMLSGCVLPANLPVLTTMQNCFTSNYVLKTVTLPTSSPLMTGFAGVFNACYELGGTVTVAANATGIISLQSTFYNCWKLYGFVLPPTLNSCTTITSLAMYGKALASVTMPTAMDTCIDASYSFYGCTVLPSLTMPASMIAMRTLSYLANSCPGLLTLNLPLVLTYTTLVLDYLASQSVLLSTLNVPTFGTNQVACYQMFSAKSLPALNWPTLRIKKLYLVGISPATTNALSSINIDWANSTYLGGTNEVQINYANLSATEINRIFAALPSVTSKTINVQSCTGSAGCDPTIATAKGWIVGR